MWDFIFKVVELISKKVSFIAMFFYLAIVLLIYILVPYTTFLQWIAPREEPFFVYGLCVFVVSTSLFLAGKQIDDYIYPRFNRWRAFKQYEGIYQALTDDERKVLMDLVSYGSAPAEIPNVKIRSNLLSKGLIQLKMYNPVFQSYIITPKFYAFLLEKIRNDS